MIVLAVAFIVAQVLGEAYTYGDENLAPGDARDASDLFRRVCLRPFPDGAAFTAAMTAQPDFKRVDATEVATLRRDGLRAPVGGVWASRTINVRYIAAGAVAPTLPQPQCIVTVRLAAAPDHAMLAAAIGDQLALGSAKPVQAGPHVRSFWDIAQPEGRGWLVMMKSQGDARGNYLRLSLIKLSSTI